MAKLLIQFIVCLFLACNAVIVNADMPKTSCNSICNSNANYTLPNGAHCISFDKKYRLYYRSLGNGIPTMIFASGTGFPADGWFDTHLATEMAKKVRVFSYDRIFTNNSCPNSNNYLPITAQDVVNQLRKLLKHENIKPPYILVGQSFGGLYMQLYAREYPNEVAGILLMDSVTSDGPVTLTQKEKDFLWHHRMDSPLQPNPENPLYNEIIGQLPSYLQLQHAPPLERDIPIIVMFATKECLPKIDNEQLCMDEKRMEKHYKEEIAIYNMSEIHRLVKVDGDHMSFFDPEKYQLVVDELNKILEMAKVRMAKLSGITSKEKVLTN